MNPTDWLALILAVVATPLVVIAMVCRVRRVLDSVLEDILKWLSIV